MEITRTRFETLGFTKRAPGFWRFVDLTTGQTVGLIYQTKAELLADLDRFALAFCGAQLARRLTPHTAGPRKWVREGDEP